MSPQLGDAPSSPDPSRSGGLANVLRGLTTSKLSKASPSIASPSSSSAQPVAEFVNAPVTGSGGGLSPNHLEAFEQLRYGAISDRVAAANTLRYAIAEYPLNPVLDIWYAAKDFINHTNPPAARTAGWELLTECVKHTSSTDLERKEYFMTLSAPAHPEDFHLQLAALVDLTNHGRVLTGFDYELVPLLTKWLQAAYKAARAARKSGSHSSRSPKAAAAGKAIVTEEQQNLALLFSFLNDVVKFSFNNADSAAVSGLIDRLLSICQSTSAEEDLRSCIAVIDNIVTFGSIPDDKLKDCVQVLSSIYCLVEALQKEAWHTLSHLCKSHNGQATVRIFLDILRHPSSPGLKERDVNRELRGALAVILKLLSKNADKGYPAIPFALLADGLLKAVKTSTSIRVCGLVLQIINALLDDGEGNMQRLIADEDWSAMLDAASECSKKLATDNAELDRVRASRDERPEEMALRELLCLITRLDILLGQRSGDFVPRQTVVDFLIKVHRFLPDGSVSAVLDYFLEFRCCSPSDLQWEENLNLVLNGFFSNRDRSSHVRLRALDTIMDAYEVVDLVGDEADHGFIPRLAKRILENVAEETNVLVLGAIMSFMVSVVASCDMELFDYIIQALGGIVGHESRSSPSSITSGSSLSPHAPGESWTSRNRSPSNVVTKGYVKMFVQTMDSDSTKAVKLYNVLIGIVNSNHCAVDARLTAMKLLFRLRADWANRIFITQVLETNFLAVSMCRTEASLAKRHAEESANMLRQSRSDHGAPSRSTRGTSYGQGQIQEKGIPARSPSTAKNNATKYRPTWSLPDSDALPDNVTGKTSPVLVSHSLDIVEGPELGPYEDFDHRVTPLNISAWMETILVLLHGRDWELYSFVLVHLPSQLSNHAIWRDAIPQIQELRRLICEQIRTNKFREPPLASGLRRADVAICLFHSLTMILSYHEHFQKGDEDEIVQTFVHGIATWERSAKCCIHALSICCHELPLSTSKSLVQMLNRMATIITQPHVSVHILEFLACLSRLHSVYMNFREEDFKIVFGICFRYLQYARDKKRSNRSNHPSEPTTPATAPSSNSPDMLHPNASEDLPQYVYALAYHVIIFWFLALKLQDRANHVGWIARNLFADVDGAQAADEQALTTIDFMQRVTYADADESSEDPHFKESRFGEMHKKRWLVGNSIVTVRQATTTGWAQIIKRQPSGTSAYTVRETFHPPPPHQEQNYVDISREGQISSNTILPSHLLIQLLSPIPQVSDPSRPIPLPDDEAVDRAIRVFDRTSTLDGHKVGIIYLSEGQTEEAESLGNTIGGSDYVEFLNNIGTLTRLKGAKFNTHGLDREFDTDGQYTFCWRDRVTEIVFHVTTQMPTNLERDPLCTLKKRHIGNDFVNIIFNDSGHPFRFDTFPGDFNFVNIVITPTSRHTFVAPRNTAVGGKSQPYYRIQVMSKPGFPEISPASETKIVSLKALPGFIRLLALNASVFSHVWANREGGEHISSWKSRLREVKRLRERYGPKTPSQPTSTSSTPTAAATAAAGASTSLGNATQQLDASRPASSVRDSLTSLRRTSVATFFTSTSEHNSHRSSIVSTFVATNDIEVGVGQPGLDSMVESVDFSKWA